MEEIGEVVNLVSVVAGKRRMQVRDIADAAGLPYDTAKRMFYATSKRLDLGTLAAVCHALDCQPGDLFEYVPGNGTN